MSPRRIGAWLGAVARVWSARPRLRLAVRVAVAALVLVLAALAARRLDVRGALRTLRGAAPGWVLLAAFLNFPLTLLQAQRWRVLLGPAGPVPVLALFRYMLAANALGNLLPARMGQVLRVYLPRARHGLPVVTVTSTLVIERFLEALGLTAVATPLLLVAPAPPWVRLGVLGLAAVALGGLAVAYALARRREAARRDGFLHHLWLSAQAVRRPAAALELVGLTLLGWGLEIALVMACLAAVGLGPSLHAAALVLLAVNLGIVVTVTPGNLGPFEAAALVALALVGVTGPRALAFALLYHLVQAVPVTLAGLDGVRLLREARRAPAPPADEPLPAAPAHGDP